MRAFLSKWGLCLMMMGATTLIYLDRQAVGLLAPTIQENLGIDNEGLGWVFSVFYYAYTAAQFGVGILLDRFSLRWLYGGAIVAWAAASTLTGLAQSFAMLLAFRILLGFMESGNWPGAMRIVSRALPPGERARCQQLTENCRHFCQARAALVKLQRRMPATIAQLEKTLRLPPLKPVALRRER